MHSVLGLLAYLPTILLASFTSSSGEHQQQPFLALAESELRWKANSSVGFSLQSSYGAAAVIFEAANGQLETHTRVYNGGYLYRQVMAKLSLESSKHNAYVDRHVHFSLESSANISSLSPPYQNDGQYWADMPRKAARLALKVAGLPASYEVGVLAQVIEHLRSQLEADFDISIYEAVFTSSHLVALYQDDLEDAANYTGIKYITPKKQFKPILWETATAYAGHGLGICEHWQDEEKCQEERIQLPQETVLAVHYSQSALTVSLAEISVAEAAWEPHYRRVENFTLGSNAIPGYGARACDYWANVKDVLLAVMTEFPLFPRPTKILVTGDKVYGDFMEFLVSTLKEYLGSVPPILPVDATVQVVSAKGAAEFMRRGPAPWSTGEIVLD